MLEISYDIEDDSFYLYSCAELKAREREFVPAVKLERMSSSAGMEEFLKVLGETFYAPEAGAIETRKNFEEVMISHYQEIIGYLLKRLKPEHTDLIHVLFFEEFLHNMKLMLKSKLLGKEFPDLYIPLRYSYDAVTSALRTGKYEYIEGPIPELIDYIRHIEVPEKVEGCRKIELDFESFYIGKMLEAAGSTGRKMITGYMRHKIDLINIEIIYRNRYLKEESGFIHLLHPGGFLDLKLLEELESESMDYIVKVLEGTEYGDVVTRGAQQLFTECTFAAFERDRNLYFLEYFDRIKYSVSNLEKIFQFFLKKKIELIKINIIFIGIKYNTSRSKLGCRVG
jgi:V/A-type H+/Na+-transporting ATPase subunit C